MQKGFLLTSLAILLLFSGLAGCLRPDAETHSGPNETETDPWAGLSPAQYEGVKRIHIPVAAPDGKLQDTWAYIPDTDDAEARFPVFINLSPYWNNLKPHPSEGGDAFGAYLIDFYVPRGYAVVLASVRGTGDSEGCMGIGGIPELEAAHAIIDHYANVEWSNGNVAMGGRSYDGTTVQGVAGYLPHPALKLIFPVSGISDLYRYNYRGGVPYMHGIIFNAYYWAGTGLQTYGDATGQDPLLIVDELACPELPFVQGNGLGSAATGLYTDYWDERNYIRYAENVQAALFYVHGFQDWNVKPDHILPWLDALPADVPKKLWMHQWEHEPSGRGGHVFPLRDDWNLTMLRVMDHFLKDMDTGILDEPMAQIEDSSGLWRNEDTWPPEHVNATPLYLNRDSTLSWEQETTDGESTLTGDGGGVLTWEIELEEEIRYAGEPVLHARLGTSDPEAAWVAQLYLIHDGETKWMNEGVLRARLKDSMHMPTPIVPMQVYDYEIRFYPQDDVFPAGSTLRLSLSQADSRHAVTPAKPAQTTLINYSEPVYLELPLYELLELEDPQPTDMYCWHC